MILEGNQRGGGRQMALHLLNQKDNEHVEVHEISGFVADDVLGAFNEIHAISKGTQCKQYMYSLSLNPPKDANARVFDFEKALEQVEQDLGLEGQPRVIVFHEKEGPLIYRGHSARNRIKSPLPLMHCRGYLDMSQLNQDSMVLPATASYSIGGPNKPASYGLVPF